MPTLLRLFALSETAPPWAAVQAAALIRAADDARYIRQMTDTLDRDDAVIASRRDQAPRPRRLRRHARAGRVAAEILDALVPHVVPGVTTGELDDIVFAEMRARGAIPPTLGYRGYTKSCCTSINHVVCHGIPGDTPLKDGDIVNIDVTPILDGWHGDTSRMFLVGDVPLKARKLVDVTYECLMLGIEQAQPGQPPRRHRPRHPEPCREASLQRGARFLRPRPRPRLPRRPRSGPCRTPGTGPELKPGMFFTIEPMINIGTRRL